MRSTGSMSRLAAPVHAMNTIAPGLVRTDAMRRFHMRRADGGIVSGGAAFAELWTALPAFSWAGRIGRQRPVSLLLEGAYRLPSCRSGRCSRNCCVPGQASAAPYPPPDQKGFVLRRQLAFGAVFNFARSAAMISIIAVSSTAPGTSRSPITKAGVPLIPSAVARR